MTFCNILVPVTGEDECEASIDAALLLAKRFKAHLVGLHVKGNPLGKWPFFSKGLAQQEIAREFASFRRHVSYTEEAARAQFEASRIRQEVPLAEEPSSESRATASFQVIARRSESTLGEVARIYDLIVMSAAGKIADEDALQSVAGVLYDSGRPVLVTPKVLPKTLGTNLFVTWNRSAQSARAVAAATQFIDAASKVSVAYVNTGAKVGRTLEEIASSLAWRGVQVDLCRITHDGEPVAELLLTHAKNAGADLMVMGAYSHSRLRDLVLGGVTRHILSDVTLPILMTH